MAKNIVVYSDGTGQDGGVRPEQRVSNVYKMYRATRVHPDNAINPAEQICFYDPGLGTDIGVTALTGPVRFAKKLLESVTGRGITRNIAECYEFIINHYQQDDRIFLIGFSRGAYTVRSLANLLMLCGVPTRTPDGPLMRFRKSTRDIAAEAVNVVLEHGAGQPRAQYEAERFEQARRFREKYGSTATDSSKEPDDANVSAYFIGVFDTVAALGASGMRRRLIQIGIGLFFTVGIAIPLSILGAGFAAIAKSFLGFPFWWTELGLTIAFVLIANIWFWRKQKLAYKKTIHDFPNRGDFFWHYAEWKADNFDRLLSKHVEHARSANAIDETRKDFDRVAWGSKANDGHLSQMWFAGNHSDIGGSYPEAESRLSDIALQWMIEETQRLTFPLKIGPVTVNDKKIESTGSEGIPIHLFPDAHGIQHCEIAGMRDTLDTYAERLPVLMRGIISARNYETNVRTIKPDARLHPTVLERFALPEVAQCGKVGKYLPDALRNHPACTAFYPKNEKGNEVDQVDPNSDQSKWRWLAQLRNVSLWRRLTAMAKEPVEPTRPAVPPPAEEPAKTPPVEDPQPGNPNEDRPLVDPIPPDGDKPRM